MKLSLCVLLSLVCGALCYVEPLRYYHETVGIAEAARIKQAEEALDFDGARIVGGSIANLGEYPYFGGLIITLVTGVQSICGSSLVSNTRLVTAAHCWNDGRNVGRQIIVVLGSLRIFAGGTRIITSNIQLHDNWNQNTFANDIAIITINPVTFSRTISPISLATGSANYAGVLAQAAGFGVTADSANINSNQPLRHVTMQVITNAVCSGSYGNRITDSNICTSGANSQSTCRGDNGGPLSIISNGQPLLIGVGSFVSLASCERGFPAAFSRVTSFVSWISARI